MKGPGNRMKLVVRRAWECPLCRRRLLTAGSVVQQACNCRPPDEGGGPVWMRLVEEPRPARRSTLPPLPPA